MQKIMFNSKWGLEQAVLEGRKTMTRRSVSDKILNKYQDYLNWWNTQKGGCFKPPEDEFYRCESPYKVNEVIAIAQAYKDVPPYKGHPEYSNHRDLSAGWDNKMFVKADLMKYYIKITGIKVERLQDISDEDCLREGIRRCNLNKKFAFDDKRDYSTAREAFAALIDKVSGKGTWDSNPWVFAYEFKLIK